MKSPQTILETLRTIAPNVAVAVHWSHDDGSFNGAGDWTEGEDPDEWQVWQSEVVASAILRGQEVSGNANLVGIWEKSSDHPATSNPDISGYLPQMLEEALEELLGQVPEGDWRSSLRSQIENALNFLKTEMRERGDEQRQQITA